MRSIFSFFLLNQKLNKQQNNMKHFLRDSSYSGLFIIFIQEPSSRRLKGQSHIFSVA